MRKIYIIRHAKAVKNSDTNDYDRNLNDRGKKDLKIMANFLASKEIVPDLVISSSAVRCKYTAKGICATLKIKNKIKFDTKLYNANIEYVLNLMQNIDLKYKNIFLVLHNPIATDLCEYLTGCAIGSIPTCSIFCMQLNETTNKITKNSTKAVFFEYPKRYRK